MTIATDIPPPYRERSTAPLYVALALAVASQCLIAASFGSLSGGARSSWDVIAALCLLLTVPAGSLVWAIWRTQASSISGVAIAVVGIAGLAMRVPYFGAGPVLEDDHFRYVLDGAILAHGLDPYSYSPLSLLDGSAPEAYLRAADAGRHVIQQVNFPDLRTIYPGTAQILFSIAHFIKPWSVDGLRVLLMMCEGVTALMALWLLGQMNLPRHLVALLWCNPLLAFSLTGQAHIDAALGPFILGSLIAVRRHAGTLAGLLLALAIGVKLWPALLAPLLVRSLGPERRAIMRFMASAGAMALLMCMGLIVASLSPKSGLLAYAHGWHINNWPYAWASFAAYLSVGGPTLEPYLRMLVVLLSIFIGIGLAIPPVTGTANLINRSALLAGSIFYLAPAQFPWYASWFLPLAVLGRNWALLAASASLPAYFLFFPLAASGSGDLFHYWLSGLHVLPVIAIALVGRMVWRNDAGGR